MSGDFKSASDWKADDTQAVELGIVTFEGKEFAALGAVVNLETGRAICYPDGEGYGAECLGNSWQGAPIFSLVCTGKGRSGFLDGTGRRTLLYSYRTVTPYLGFHWFGRGLGKGMLLKLRKGRKG